MKKKKKGIAFFRMEEGAKNIIACPEMTSLYVYFNMS